MKPEIVRKEASRRPSSDRFWSALLLAGSLCGVAAAEEGSRWWVCTDPSALAKQLNPIAAHIDAEVGPARREVLVNVAPLGEGSTEYLIASTAEVFGQLSAQLSARRVPLRRVSFQWLSSFAALPPAEPLSCRGTVVFVEVTSAPS